MAQAVEVEVGAGVDRHERRAREPALGRVALEPRERHRAGRLGHGAGAVEHVLHGGADLVRRHGDDLVEARAADPKGFDAGLAHRHAVGEKPHAVEHHAAARREGGLHGGGVVGLDADHLDVGPEELDEGGDAGREPAPAHGHEDRLDGLGVLLKDLHPHRALAGDDVRVVVGRHVGEAALGAKRLGMAGGLVEGVADDHGFAAARPHARDLDAGRRARHDDDRRDAEPLAREGDALRVVAGRGRDDAARQRFARQARHLVIGAADLEREDRLEVFALEQHAVVEPRRQRGQGVERRADRDVVDARGEDAARVVVEVHRVGRRLRPGQVQVHRGRARAIDAPGGAPETPPAQPRAAEVVNAGSPPRPAVVAPSRGGGHAGARAARRRRVTARPRSTPAPERLPRPCADPTRPRSPPCGRRARPPARRPSLRAQRRRAA